MITDPRTEDACDYCDRCLWGCPRAAIYNPRLTTLADCEAYRGFRYVPGRLVLALLSTDHRITGIRYLDTSTHADTRGAVRCRISRRRRAADRGDLPANAEGGGLDVALHTEGLMDTTVVKIPFVSLASVGRPPDARSFQFNRLILGDDRRLRRRGRAISMASSSI